MSYQSDLEALQRQISRLQKDIEDLKTQEPLQARIRATLSGARILRLINNPTDDEWFAEVLIVGATLTAGATTTVSTEIDIGDYGVQHRGGYLVWGTLNGDDNSSNQRALEFLARVRSMGTGTESGKSGTIVADETSGLVTAVVGDLNSDILGIDFTVGASSAVNEYIIHAFITKQNL